MTQDELAALFAKNARAVSAEVHEVASLDEALGHVAALCCAKAPCDQLLDRLEARPGSSGELLDAGRLKTLAAPNLDDRLFADLDRRCRERGVSCLRQGLREHLGGVDVGFTLCQAAAADTGTLLLDSACEEVRLATMLAEVHVAAVKKSAIRSSLLDLEDELGAMAGKSGGYAACITGPSRTADIERVLALGVHGPLELVVLLLED